MRLMHLEDSRNYADCGLLSTEADVIFATKTPFVLVYVVTCSCCRTTESDVLFVMVLILSAGADAAVVEQPRVMCCLLWC